MRLLVNELKRMWKEVVIGVFKALSWHFPGGTEKNHNKTQSGYPVSRTRFELRTSKYEARVLTTRDFQ
jgi:hypothetical protein